VFGTLGNWTVTFADWMPRSILGRNPRRVLAGAWGLATVLRSLLGVRVFRNPLQVARHYLLRKCPPGLYVDTRSGLHIHLSGDEDDIPTLLVVFGRKDYGRVPKNAVCIDVGAHLGSFSLYAIASGAAAVYSYEPDPILYKTLLQNVQHNHLTSRIVAFQAAVVGLEIASVTFYPEGNAAGHVDPLGDDRGGILVKALTLTQIILDKQLERIDLLKLDCEGSEYEIVFNTAPEIWNRIERVRLEYHRGRADELKRHFSQLGYVLTFSSERKGQNHRVGLLGFDHAGLTTSERSPGGREGNDVTA
jgi:FkbM family methyltransferase